jgi:hypothetical protein
MSEGPQDGAARGYDCTGPGRPYEAPVLHRRLACGGVAAVKRLTRSWSY